MDPNDPLLMRRKSNLRLINFNILKTKKQYSGQVPSGRPDRLPGGVVGAFRRLATSLLFPLVTPTGIIKNRIYPKNERG